MHPDEMFTGANFMARISVADKNDLFVQLCRQVATLPQVRNSAIDYDRILSAIREREAQSSTAIGNGVILPHATLQTPLSGEEAIDRQPLDIACLLLIPAGKPMEGLKFMARFANFVQMPELRGELMKASSPEAMFSQLSNLGQSSRKAVLAGDIMSPCSFSLAADMPLTRATTLMAQHRTPIAPVLDGRRLLGQIACSNLFTLGIPDFFSQLKSVGFIRFFDPFEKYFSIEARSKVGQVMNTDYCTFHEDATLIEIVFAISILKYPQVYIVNQENELLGIIDQTLLLERIINL